VAPNEKRLEHPNDNGVQRTPEHWPILTRPRVAHFNPPRDTILSTDLLPETGDLNPRTFSLLPVS